MTDYDVVDLKGLQALGLKRSRTQIDRDEKAGRFPASFKLHPGRGGRRLWWLKEIIEWLKSKSGR
jgi:predicted DNA-binding transcriptional regulator AlpA